MKRSNFLKLNAQDLLRGMLMAFLTALMTGLLQLFQEGPFVLDWPTFQPIVFASLAAMLSYFIKNYLTNSEGQIARGERSAAEYRAKRGKLVILLPFLMLLSASVSAQQSPFKGFFSPVTVDQVQSFDGEKALSGTVLIRPELTIAGNVLKPVYTDGTFTGFESSFATRVGMGLSYSLYKVVNDQPYNVYSFAAQLSLATIEKPNAGLLVTASAFDLYGLSPSLGLGYDFIKDSPVKQNFFIMWGLSHTF
jgi:hypothetical protein